MVAYLSTIQRSLPIWLGKPIIVATKKNKKQPALAVTRSFANNHEFCIVFCKIKARLFALLDEGYRERGGKSIKNVARGKAEK